MQAIVETVFDVVYLITVITLGIRMVQKSKGQTQFRLFGYMAIVLGCQARKNRILLGIGVYIGLSMAEQFLMSIAIVSMALMPDFTMALLYLFGFRQADPDTIYAVLELFLTGVLVFELVIGGVYYFVVRRMLIHRLNLE